ncbi:MAG TPA: enoyl-CoA hydratase/isomerase family protein [Vicinamibacteria bacterium]|nr:enoyl-CoA hydratase/isomerase family protein [Vicinamibacteria bacterium]
MEATKAFLEVEPLEHGALWDVVFGGTKGNILDLALIEQWIALFEKARTTPDLRAVRIRGEGAHFSFGASVEEHLPGEVTKMLPRFHQLFRSMVDSGVVCLAIVRGNCLGGGLELASFCHRVFASPDAKLGQPEIVLGVFAPIASMLLSERIGRANAEDLCLSGRIVASDEALRMGLVDAVSQDPEAASLHYAREHLLHRSASSLRYAVKAARFGVRARLDEELRALERIYLDELMETEDAIEGLKAFVDKRPPRWRNA